MCIEDPVNFGFVVNLVCTPTLHGETADGSSLLYLMHLRKNEYEGLFKEI